MVAGQWRFSQAGYLTGLDLTAAREAVDIYAGRFPGLAIDRPRLISDLLALGDWVAAEQNKALAASRERNR